MKAFRFFEILAEITGYIFAVSAIQFILRLLLRVFDFEIPLLSVLAGYSFLWEGDVTITSWLFIAAMVARDVAARKWLEKILADVLEGKRLPRNRKRDQWRISVLQPFIDDTLLKKALCIRAFEGEKNRLEEKEHETLVLISRRRGPDVAGAKNLRARLDAVHGKMRSMRREEKEAEKSFAFLRRAAKVRWFSTCATWEEYIEEYG